MSWKNVQYENGKYRTSEGGGGGSSTFAGLDDVSFNNIQNGQVPKYNSTTQKWENANESGGGHNYSTTEQVIGTWIDGKPLYEKTVEYSSNIATGSWTTLFSDNVTDIKNYEVRIYNNSQKASVAINHYFRSTSNYFTTLQENNSIRVYNVGDTRYGAVLTIQYTKTTDV